jgi:hypothetical protein
VQDLARCIARILTHEEKKTRGDFVRLARAAHRRAPPINLFGCIPILATRPLKGIEYRAVSELLSDTD